MSDDSIFTVGGTVQASNGLYIPRRADEELLALCRTGNFAYVLTPRQLGKSSLMVNTSKRLTEEGVPTVIIDLSQIGVQVNAEQWYLGLLSMIEEQLDLLTDGVKWWREHAHLGVTQRLTMFFEDVLLKEVNTPVVVFVDEIDTTLSLNFTDDFFAAIRYFYNARAVSSDVQRLSFVLIGVATPSDLIRDPQRTPFNVGQRVDLTDFTLEEALPLAAGLNLPHEKARQVLSWIMKWTNGHPYLTQRLCRALMDERKRDWSEADIDAMVGKTFFGKISEEDNNLQFVRDMLTKRAPNLSEVLQTYRQVIRRRPVPDDEQSIIQSHLKLSGIAHRQQGELKVRNPIYAHVFNDGWVKQHLPVNWARRFTRVATGLVVTLMILSIPTAIWAIAAQRKAVREKSVAEEQAKIAQKQTSVAEIERKRAEDANRATEQQRQLAVAAAKNEKLARQQEGVQRQKALQAAAAAMEQKSLAEFAAMNAKRAEKIAEEQRAEADKLRLLTEDAFKKEQAAKKQAQAAGQEAERLRKIADDLRAKAVEESKANAQQRDVAQAQHQLAVARQLADQGQQQLSLKNGPAAEAYLARALTLNDQPTTRRALLDAKAQTARAVEYPLFKGISIPTMSRDFYDYTLSPDGRFLGLKSMDGTIAIVDSYTEKATRLESRSHTAPDFGSLIFSADGKQIAQQNIIGEVQLWDISTHQFLGTLKYKVDRLVAFDLSTKRLIQRYHSSSGKRGIQSLDLESGTKVAEINLPDQSPGIDDDYPLKFSDDGKVVAIPSNKSIALYETETGKSMGVVSCPVLSINEVKFTRDKRKLVCLTTSEISLWELTGENPTKTFSIYNQIRDFVTMDFVSLAFNPDGTKLATIIQGYIRVWDTDSKREITSITANYLGYALRILMDPPGNLLVVEDLSDKITRVWNIETGALVNTFYCKGPVLEFTADGRDLYSVSQKTLVKWDLNTNEAGKLLFSNTRTINSILLSSNGKFLATQSSDGSTQIWDLQQGKSIGFIVTTGTLHDFDPERLQIGTITESAAEDGTRFYRVYHLRTKQQMNGLELDGQFDTVLSPNGRVVVMKDETGAAEKLKNLETNVEFVITPSPPTAPRDALYIFAFSNDSLRFAQARSDGQIKVWNVDTGKEDVVLSGQKLVSGLSFSPDDRTIAVSYRDSVQFWDLGAKRLRSGIPKINGGIREKIFSPDGKRFAAILGNSRVKVWDVATGNPVSTLINSGNVSSINSENVSSLVFSPDGKWLITHGTDTRLWNLEMSNPEGFILPVETQAKPVFTSDGWLAYGDQQNIRLWDFEVIRQVATANCWEILKDAKSNTARTLVGFDFDRLPQVRLQNILGKYYSPFYELINPENALDRVQMQEEADRKSELAEKETKIDVTPEGTITGTISFDGDPPPARRIDTEADPICTKINPTLSTDDWIVTNGKLANVFVYVKAAGGQFDKFHFEPPRSEVIVQRKGCQTIPHVVGLQVNQLVTFFNNDDTQHNYHILPKKNPEWNATLTAGNSFDRSFTRAEVLIPLRCNQHPWERSYIGVLPHPFFAVTNKDGVFTIPGLPPGKYTLVAWHEGGADGIEKSMTFEIALGESKTINFVFSKP